MHVTCRERAINLRISSSPLNLTDLIEEKCAIWKSAKASLPGWKRWEGLLSIVQSIFCRLLYIFNSPEFNTMLFWLLWRN